MHFPLTHPIRYFISENTCSKLQMWCPDHLRITALEAGRYDPSLVYCSYTLNEEGMRYGKIQREEPSIESVLLLPPYEEEYWLTIRADHIAYSRILNLSSAIKKLACWNLQLSKLFQICTPFGCQAPDRKSYFPLRHHKQRYKPIGRKPTYFSQQDRP